MICRSWVCLCSSFLRGNFRAVISYFGNCEISLAKVGKSNFATALCEFLRTIPSKLGFLFSTKLSTDGVFSIGVGVEHPTMRNYLEERDIWAGPHLVIVISFVSRSVEDGTRQQLLSPAQSITQRKTRPKLLFQLNFYSIMTKIYLNLMVQKLILDFKGKESAFFST